MTGFIGGGFMAEALIKGMTDRGMRDIIVSEPVEERRQYLERTFGVKTINDNKLLLTQASLIVLAVKPQSMAAALEGIAGSVKPEHMFVSIAAGITIGYIQERLKTSRIIRVMPNVASMVQEGMAVLALCECFPDNEVAKVRDIFMSSGRVLTMPEKKLNAVTALSGSGPAFITYFLCSMIEGGVKEGLTEDEARGLLIQTLRGTAALLDTGLSCEKLIRMVKSPGGTTEAGLGVLEEHKVRDTIIGMIAAARKRGAELAQ